MAPAQEHHGIEGSDTSVSVLSTPLATTPVLDLSVALRPEQKVTTVTNGTAKNPAVQVAREALKQGVDDSAISAVNNVRQILIMLRESIKREDPEVAAEELKGLETRWQELETIYASIQGASDTPPDLSGEQNNTANVPLDSVTNSAYQGVQPELKVQHDKVNRQHGLITDQRRAYEDSKARSESALQALHASHVEEVSALKDSLSRMTLTNGCLRTDLEEKTREALTKYNEYKDRVAQEQKKNEMLTKELGELQVKFDNQSSDYSKVLASSTEQKKNAEVLQKQIGDLKDSVGVAQAQLGKVTAERDVVAERALRAKAAAATAEATSKTLEEELIRKNFDSTQKEAELQTLSGAVDILKQKNAKLTTKGAELQQKVEYLNSQLFEMKSSRGKVKTENDILKAENDQLKTQLKEAKSSIAESKARTEQSSIVESKGDLEKQLETANALAIALHDRYKTMLPIYKKADEYRKENEDLKEKLVAQASDKANDTAAYWREQYHQLLGKFED